MWEYLGRSNGYDIYFDGKYTYKYDIGELKTVPDKTNAEGKRTHKATYARDKKKGGYNIRVVGPNAAEFAGEEVPVETMSGEEHQEKLVSLLWTGPDKEPTTGELTGRIAALYSFEAKPREETAKPIF
jgi:hypothetical protein